MVKCMDNRHYKIKYHTISITGNVRKNNEDNFFSLGVIKSPDNQANQSYFCNGETDSSDNCFFAVFDGMGGEEKGELASYISAKSAVDYTFDNEDIAKSLLSFTESINRNVRNYADKNQVEIMGTTFAGVVFSGENAYIGNVGDSKVFCISGGKINQISVDHILPKELAFRNILTQYVGMGENDSKFVPAVSDKILKPGDRYIICSDGLTEKLSTNEIGALCSVAQTVSDAADILVSQALSMGSSDNITVTVCEILNSGF